MPIQGSQNYFQGQGQYSQCSRSKLKKVRQNYKCARPFQGQNHQFPNLQGQISKNVTVKIPYVQDFSRSLLKIHGNFKVNISNLQGTFKMIIPNFEGPFKFNRGYFQGQNYKYTRAFQVQYVQYVQSSRASQGKNSIFKDLSR